MRLLLPAAFLAIVGCSDPEDRLPLDDAPVRRPTSQAPDALMVRFEAVKGTGSTRESWEIEVLQMGDDVRVRGSVRTGPRTIPVLHTMTPGEYVEFWQWLARFPYDRARLVEDETAPATDWRKTLQVDVVLGPEERRQSRNTWTRPLVEATWVDEMEHRLHDMTLNLAEIELTRQMTEDLEEDPIVGNTARDAMKILGEGEESNLPGGSPDVD